MSRNLKITRPRACWIALLMVSISLSSAACNRNRSAADSANSDSAKATAKSGQEASKTKPDADVPAADIYPDINLGVLEGAERVKFVDMAKAEVCPCPESAESLHACLQDSEKACGLALQVAGHMARGIKMGAQKTDILDEVGQFVENARKTHQFDYAGVPFKGKADAPVKIVEFADFQCPHCKVASGVLHQVFEKDSEKIAIYFKEFPLGGHS